MPRRIDAPVALVEAPPNGILHLLDHQCRAPNASEQSFCAAVNEAHGRTRSSRCPSCRRRAPSTRARASSCATMRATCSTRRALSSRSTSPTLDGYKLRGAVRLPPLHRPRRCSRRSGGRGTFASVAQRFSADLTRLLRTLQATDAHFIRCVKPDLQMRPRAFDARARSRPPRRRLARRAALPQEGAGDGVRRPAHARTPSPPAACRWPPTLRDDAMPAAEWAAALTPSACRRRCTASSTARSPCARRWCHGSPRWKTRQCRRCAGRCGAPRARAAATAEWRRPPPATGRREARCCALAHRRDRRAKSSSGRGHGEGTARTDAIRAAADGVARSWPSPAPAPAPAGTAAATAAGTAAGAAGQPIRARLVRRRR